MCEVIAEVEMVSTVKVYSVPDYNLGKLTEVIGKLNKRAAKIGVAPIAFSSEFDCVKKQYMVNIKNGGCETVAWLSDEEAAESLKNGNTLLATGPKSAVFKVTIEGVSPKYDGWSFAGTLEPVYLENGEAENMIKCVPGKEIPKSVAARIGQCDQCKKHRKRSETFVVQHESGEYKVIGRNCIGDFLGGIDPHQAANFAQWLMDIDEAAEDCESFEGFGSSGYKSGEEADVLYPMTAAVIDHLGWRSKSSCEFGGLSTASAVFGILHPHPLEDKFWKQLRSEVSVTDSHEATAEAAVAWAKGLSDEVVENNNYLSNCRLVAKCGWIGSKNVGIACSMIAAYLKEQAKLKEQERKAKLPPSQHVGAVKERLVLELTVEKIIVIPNEIYGDKGLHKMVDASGNVFAWFASANSSWLTEGETVKVKATVVEHDEYKGVKQTIVNRVQEYVEPVKKPKKSKAAKAAEAELVAAKEKVW